MLTHPNAFALVARDYAASAIEAGEATRALEDLQALYQRVPSLDLLAAIGLLDALGSSQRFRVAEHLQKHPSLSAARELLKLRAAERGASEDADVRSIESAIAHAAKPLQRYRCAACGFEAQNYFWQCPGCLNWDSYPDTAIGGPLMTAIVDRKRLEASRVLVVATPCSTATGSERSIASHRKRLCLWFASRGKKSGSAARPTWRSMSRR